jgi:hypothetical protein
MKTFHIYLSHSENFFQTLDVEKIKTHILNSITFSKNCFVYKIMSKNVVEPERTANDIAIWRIRAACWISKATRTHAHAHARAPTHTHIHAGAHTERQIYNTYCFSTVIMFSKSVSVLRYRYIACLVYFLCMFLY